MNIDAEKQLWVSIQSKGILHTDVQDLYHKARSAYENVILNNHEVVDLQDVEYSLWKLHYKYIDEFRKRIRSISINLDNTKSETRKQDVSNVLNSLNSHVVERFKLFLCEAIEFYKDLISKFRHSCGLPEGYSVHKKSSGCTFSVESEFLHKRHYAIHRFLVCLGDLARYKELCKKPDGQNRKWAVAATYYLEATMIWPDSGNPQNQLALLATYVGDDFLALYHCIRSLAVKEPFPDAWDNLTLLFEKNRSSHLHSLSSKAHFDWSKALKRRFSRTKGHSSSDSFHSAASEFTELVSNGKSEFWPLFVRLISFFLTKSSLEDFPCTYASTISELEAMLELDDTKLMSSLEPYEKLDPSRKGPYRALQFVSILIFLIHTLYNRTERKDPKGQLYASMQLAWACIFTFMGRFLDRCLLGDNLECCPLSAAVLVFVEWLVGMLDEAVTYTGDDKVSIARSYFLEAFVEFLNQIHAEGEVNCSTNTALWEDYELRGFGPIIRSHDSLDFSAHNEHSSRYDDGSAVRLRRFHLTAMKIVNSSNGSRNWICCRPLETKFYIPNVGKTADLCEDLIDLSSDQATNEDEIGNGRHIDVKGESCTLEEEEVILFKPITRYNSAPIFAFNTSDQTSLEGTKDQAAHSDDLRRATSLFVGQSEANSHPSSSNFRFNRPFKQQESSVKDPDAFPSGPPSLSGWVLNRESLNFEREKEARHVTMHELPPIEELPSASFTNLSISEAAVSPYVAPVPSAPLLPENAVWFRGNSTEVEGSGILGAPPVSGFSNLPATHSPLNISLGSPSFFDGYTPVHRMSSSEWLYHYRNNQNLEQANNHLRPGYTYEPGSPRTHNGYDASRLDLFDQWGNLLVSRGMVPPEEPHVDSTLPFVFGTEERKMEKPTFGYQRPSPYGCGVGTEQPQLLQYLKEREWQLQREAPLRGPPTYMGK